MNRRDLSKKISSGLFVSSVDLLLFSVSLGINLYGAAYPGRNPIQVLEGSFKMLSQFQKKLLSSSTAYAKSKAYLTKKDGVLRITVKGKRRLASALPDYQHHRSWDNRLYLITYDIKEESRGTRYRLNRWLKMKKAVMLQKSVWVSVYDLSSQIQENFKLDFKQGSILISSLKQGEGIGGKSLAELISSWYDLGPLNLRYQQFMVWIKGKRSWSKEAKLIMSTRFLSILRDDPQLPIDLLPANWQGDIAFKIYKSILDRK